MIKTVLVTGANGFVGSHILETLQKRDDVRIIASCRDSKKLATGFQGEIREGDLRNQSYRKSLVEGIDVLCHAAAWSALWGHANESRTAFLEPTLALIDNARAAGVSRFINTSTTSAASPNSSNNPLSRGIPRPFWPHLCNLIAIEDALRARACPDFQVINLRLGIFAGKRYSLGVLPILAPRLKTHLVPWVASGRTSLPITDGRDIGQAFALAVTAGQLSDFEGFNIVGPEIPTVRQVITLLHDEYNLPLPHFSVPFFIAYPFAWLMEMLDPIVPWEPLVTRSIVHLMEEVNANNQRVAQKIGYCPHHHWQEAIRDQMAEMAVRERVPMKMARPVS
ncbi:MAG: NAD-dependent epimerase/dehydratase family protein [Burkholderiales bacterium]